MLASALGLQQMRKSRIRIVRTDRQSGRITSRIGVAAGGRAFRPGASRAATEVGFQSATSAAADRRRRLLELELLLRAVDEAEVVHAGVRLRRLTSADEVRDRDRGQEADDGNHDHDFNEREARFLGGIDLHN